MKVEQTKEELKSHLIEQFRFIQKSSKEFDEGDVSEAKRIAIHTRVLFHDTKHSKSLLLTIGEKDKIQFLNSSLPFNPRNLMPYTGLVSTHIINDNDGFRGQFKPLLHDYLASGGKEDWKSFDDWWNGVIIKDQQGNMFSRKDLILHVADTDGGAHVDRLYENYVALSRNNSLGWATVERRKGEADLVNPIKNIELSSVRQIAFEVCLSLARYYNII